MNFEKIRELIIDIVSCNEDEVTPDTDLKEDLGMDSLDAMELAMSIEENLGVTIPEDKIGDMVYVKDIVAYVDENPAE